jgi:CheY-like chemotaxis protein
MAAADGPGALVLRGVAFGRAVSRWPALGDACCPTLRWTGFGICTDILPHNQVPFTPPKPIAPTPEELRGATILVVDDERAWRVILETDLRMLGYKVSMAEDADQALERAQADSPEVAIIDLMLPEPMDGWGLLNALRARGQKVPVIFYTAYPVFPSGTDDPDVVGYMSKAVDRADLYALLPPAIKRSRERLNNS